MDNTFAEQVQAIVGFSIPSPSNNRRARLCKRCDDLDFWVGGFSLEDTAANLEHCAKYCDFCNMLQDACKREKSVRGSQIQLDRVESNLKLANAELPTLSIIRSPGMSPYEVLIVGFSPTQLRAFDSFLTVGALPQ